MVDKVKITYKGESRMVPKTYVEGLKGYERQKQIKSIFEGKTRPKTIKTKRSSWVEKFEKKYKTKITDKKFINDNLLKTKGQNLIIKKGIAAYFTSGSRPSVSKEQWGLARLASVLLNGPSRKIDKDIYNKYKV